MTNQPLTKQNLEEILDAKLTVFEDKVGAKFAAFEVRFETKLDAKLATLRDDLETKIGESTAELVHLMDTRFNKVEARLDTVERRLGALVSQVDHHAAIIGYNLQAKRLKHLPTYP